MPGNSDIEWTDRTWNPVWVRNLRDRCQAAGVPGCVNATSLSK